MHELSIALSILEGVAEEADRQGGARVHVIHLRLGPLSGVVKEALNFSFELAREGTPFEKSALVIEEIPITIFCPTCQTERGAVSIQRLCCSVCDTPSSGIVHGNELEISSLEIDA